MKHHAVFVCSLEQLPAIRAFIRASLPETEDVFVNQVALAVDELFTNAIIHSQCAQNGRNLEITIYTDIQGVNLEIKDTALPFPIDQRVQIDCLDKIRNREKGGLGLFLIQQIMDEISVQAAGEFHIVKLRKLY
jgi:serine/threonine-protein kinase RsbW